MDIKILVCTHKQYKMPGDTSLYMPVQAGCDEVQERLGYQADNTGDNISYKHKYYSEWSVIYWAWKNLDADYIGICHYRRYFASRRPKRDDEKCFRYILSREEVERLLTRYPVIVSKKRHYYIESIEEQYDHAHNPQDFQMARQIVQEMFPAYLDAFNQMAAQTSGHMFDLFIMGREYLDQMCSFVFPVLFELEKRSDFSWYDEYQSRVCGFIAERLLDVWLIKNQIPYQEVRVIMLEKPNWPRKIWNFMKRKFLPGARPFSAENAKRGEHV